MGRGLNGKPGAVSDISHGMELRSDDITSYLHRPTSDVITRIMTMITAPNRTEAAEYYFTYIDQVGAGDILEILEAQGGEKRALLNGISEDDSLHRYAPEKWSIREVVAHLNDTERLFVFRAFWFARGFDSPLASFDQNITVRALAYIAAGHVTHHSKVLRERYL